MSRILVHVVFALVWAGLATYVSRRYLESAESVSDVFVWSVRVLGAFAISTMGMAVLLWSWLKFDAVAHGKPKGMALTYTLMSIPSCGLAMVVYFFATRDRRVAAVATLQFAAICFAVLAVAIATVQ